MLIYIVITLLCFSAFFSGSETAILSLNYYRVSSDAEDGDKTALKLKGYVENPENFLSTVLLGNTLANIAAASLFTLWLSELQGLFVITGTFALSIFILIFCEMLPKSIAARNSYRFARTVLPILRICEIIMYPCLKPINSLSKRYLRPTKDNLSHHDMRRIVRVAAQQLPNNERIMLEGTLGLSTSCVETLMTPRHLVPELTLSDIGKHAKLNTLPKSTHIIAINMDKELLGVISQRDFNKLSSCKKPEEIDAYIAKPYYIQESTLLSNQLANFQSGHHSVSIVINEYGQMLGVLDLNDILAEIIGRYAHRHTLPPGAIKKTQSGNIWIKAQTRVRDLNKAFEWRLPQNDAHTLGGLLIDTMGCIPDGLCSIEIQNIRFTVTEIKNSELFWIEAHIG